MVINPVADNSIIKSGLQDTRSRVLSDLTSRDGFDKIFSSAIDSVKTEKAVMDKAKVADVAEIIRLEMLRNSLSLGEMNSEHVPCETGRTISLLLDGREEFGKNASGPDKVGEEPVISDSNGNVQGPDGLGGIISRASERYQVDAGLIKAIIKAESNFNSQAVSRAGAEGLMQLMPSTARGLGVTNSFDPEQNVMAGTRFLRQMLDRYNGNINSALAAYNWGPGNLERRDGVLPRETREYLIKVKGYYEQYSV